MPVAVFFPRAHNRVGIAAAVAICERCEVRERCAEQAAEEPYGVWGGIYRSRPLEPEDLRKDARPINHGTDSGYGSHRQRAEPACEDCLRAHREANQDRYARARRRKMGAL